MKSYTLLAMLASFLSGIILDMTLSRVATDAVFIAALIATVFVLVLTARPRKKNIPRRKSRVVKSRKVATSR